MLSGVRLVCCLFWALLSGACFQPDAESTAATPAGGPTLSLIDSFTLEETSEAFLGRVPHTFAVDSSGGLYIADLTTDRLMVYSPDGALSHVVGTHGSGPGEFRSIEALTMPRAGMLLQGSQGTVLSVWRLDSVAEVGRIHRVGAASSWAASGKRLLIGSYSHADSLSVIVTTWDSVLRVPADAWLRPTIGALPRAYTQFPALELFNQVIVGLRNDTMLLGFGATDYLTVVPLAGGSTDTIQIPSVRRRVVTRADLARLSQRPMQFTEIISSIPNLLGLWLSSEGHVVLWFQEGSAENVRQGSVDILGHAFIAVLSPDLKQACVEAFLDAPGSGRTRLAFARDTLYSLDQVIETTNGTDAKVYTVVRRYVVDLDGCDWRPTGNRPGY